jgi:hypothetical protein
MVPSLESEHSDDVEDSRREQMSTSIFREEAKVKLKANDPRLLRAANRIIRLYGLAEVDVYCVRPESLANVIAHEVNRDLPTGRNE